MKKNILALFTILGLSTNVFAATTTTMNASATLQSSCFFNMPTINLGETVYNYDKVQMTQLEFICSKETTAVVSINGGNDGESFRYMTNGEMNSDKLEYKLSLPGFPDKHLGDGTNGTYTFNLVGSGTLDFQWISALVRRGQYVKPGSYSDTLTITFTY